MAYTTNKNISTVASINKFIEELLTKSHKEKYVQKALTALQCDNTQKALVKIISKNIPKTSEKSVFHTLNKQAKKKQIYMEKMKLYTPSPEWIPQKKTKICKNH